jgi:hypothetical protein
MPVSPIQYLSVTFLEDVVFDVLTVKAGTTTSLQKDIARGLGKSVLINGPGQASLAYVAGGIAPVSVTGNFVVGGTLVAQLAAGWAATSFQWTRNGVPISGATGASYSVTSADAGTSINCIAIGLSYAAVGGPIDGAGAVLAYDGGTASSTYLGESLSGGSSNSTYTLPPIDGGTA